ncbi:hypothetical protein BD311DRAFT_743310 [Dichomitus squalens]|uniref:Uncharacterized protein n=1 Tax=Dichomitus squalens TaxID=114155 RepID=A0A4Q9M4P3_9APHY|nr:hypothetical protein BD311DRAFT_743310 [Dichomitus squalens]
MAGIRSDTEFEGVRAFAQRARANLLIAYDAILTARVAQTHYANLHRQEEPDIAVGSLVILSTQNLSFPKGRARKLIPKYIGPYTDMKDRRINPTFHASLLRRHEANDDVLFPHRDSTHGPSKHWHKVAAVVRPQLNVAFDVTTTMDAQQPPHQHLAAMPVDIDGQQQQQQQQQQLQHTNPHFTMPAPGNIAQPSMFQGNTSVMMGMPMGLDPRYQLTPSYMGYAPQTAHAGPIQPFVPPAPTSVSMPPGMPPLLMSRPTSQWIVLSDDMAPLAAFDSDMEDDDVDSESEGYNVKKGKQRAFNNANRAVLRRTRERLISQVTGTTPRQPAPPPPAPTLPALGPSAGLDPPRVQGGVRQPHMSVWPEATPVQAADAWSDYVPLNHHQYWELVRSARAQGGGAYNRVRDLLRQYDANGALGAFNYLHQLKMSWLDPHRAETRSQARRARDFGREARNPGMRNPSRMDPLERWLEYWHQYPDTLPVYLPIPPQLGRPTWDHTRGHILLHALIPKLKGAQQSAERARFLEVTTQLFSIPGLYRRIVDEGHYSEVTNVSIFDLAAWYAHCRLSAASIALMQPLMVRMRQFYERRNPNSGEAFLKWPCTMAEVTAVPALAELALQENPGATTGHATAPPPLVIEGVDVDATMGEAQGVGEGQADEPGPSGTVLSIDAPSPSPPSA